MTNPNWQLHCIALERRIAELEAEVEELKSPKLAASTLGMIGGRSKSEAKAKAARENGKKGGRPKKKG